LPSPAAGAHDRGLRQRRDPAEGACHLCDHHDRFCIVLFRYLLNQPMPILIIPGTSIYI
jgi:hypothetical protein